MLRGMSDMEAHVGTQLELNIWLCRVCVLFQQRPPANAITVTKACSQRRHAVSSCMKGG